ncbi:hypothetical protein IAQ61_003208 [Plenodomus lingam]|uniref:uncharacterized protein n=1 Tax=Leptosphaeria maculans TaxID=5022 RepID=UPI00331996EE|nr:hypothetical protein IAQ61_003208 [Plenodomus lingam]
MKVAAFVAAVSAFLPTALACLGHEGGVPKAVGTKTNSKVIEVKAGETFDGQWYRYDRGSGACSNQAEGGKSFVEFFSPHNPIKEDAAGKESWVIGGGAYHASDKVIQHNGCGTVNIINFYVEDYGKLYRSCGNGVTAKNGGELAGINSNYGDTATLKNVCSDAKTKCQMYTGCAGGCEPKKNGVCPG